MLREGNGTPLQYSCLENPRDRRAWWAAIYGGRVELDMIEALYQQSKKKSQMIISTVKGEKWKNSAPIILKILSKLGLGRNFLNLKKNISRTCPTTH